MRLCKKYDFGVILNLFQNLFLAKSAPSKMLKYIQRDLRELFIQPQPADEIEPQVNFSFSNS